MQFEQLQTIPCDVPLAVFVASYEGRCLSIAQELNKTGFEGEAIVLFCSDVLTVETRRNLDDLSALFPNRCKVVPITARSPNDMIAFARTTRWPSRLLIDVSCLNRENLFAFFWSLRLGMNSLPQAVFGYTSPMNYGSWLSARQRGISIALTLVTRHL